MIRRFLAAAVVVCVALILLVIAWPNLFGLAEAPLVAQLVSLRALTSTLAIGAALTLVLLAVLWAGARKFLATLAVFAFVFAAVNVAVLSTRGFGGTAPPSAQSGDDAVPGDATELIVLTWNTRGDAPGVERIAELVITEQADIVVLPETSQETAVAIAERTRDADRPMWVYTVAFDQVAKARSTSVLVSAELGEYRIDDTVGNTTVLPSIVLRPLDGVGPSIIGVHPVAPRLGDLANWRTDLRWVESVCRGEQMILAGDLNATADHFSVVDPELGAAGLGMGECLNAGLLTGNGAVGTWPTVLPPLLGAPIDHIFVTPDITVTEFRVISTPDEDAGQGTEQGSSDHRPVVARVVVG
jgi:endonuclease/exonuclease/phosphatase (EEP) superfamily protein YafD